MDYRRILDGQGYSNAGYPSCWLIALEAPGASATRIGDCYWLRSVRPLDSLPQRRIEAGEDLEIERPPTTPLA